MYNSKMNESSLENRVKELEELLKMALLANVNNSSSTVLNEISRKEDVILHKDQKASRLIEIIREKNLIIKNLIRRYGLRNLNKSEADINKNWRLRK